MYAGAFVVLFAMASLLVYLSSEHSDGGFFGWALLVWAVIAAVAVGFELAGERVAAGLFAFVSLVAFSVAAGSFEDLIGILDDLGDGPFDGFRIGLLLLDLVIITVGFILLARFGFPLLVLPVAFIGWFFLVDLVSGGGTWSAIVSIFVGLVFMLVGAAADRIYGFWIHVVAGLAIGGAFLYLWHSATWEWILIGLIALLYFLLAGALDRSSYAVFGAIGLFLDLGVPRRQVDGRRGLQPALRRCAERRFQLGFRRAERVGRSAPVRPLRARAGRDRPLARPAPAGRDGRSDHLLALRVKRARRMRPGRCPRARGPRTAAVHTLRCVRIGVLAVQGDFREHAEMLRLLGADVVEVRKPEDLEGVDGLVVPGGESTTFMRLMRLYGLDSAVAKFEGPILGTCAGMIVLDRNHLGLVDVEVARNAYGRQTSSFEADLTLEGGTAPLRGVFIRAPRVQDAGPAVEVLAELDGEPVLLRDGRFIVASFHPELTGDTRVHELFLDLVEEASVVRTQ